MRFGGQRGIQRKGWLRGLGDPDVRQRRYPCLRQEFHSIDMVKMGKKAEESKGCKRPFLPSMGIRGILERVAMVTTLAWDL